MSPVGVPLPLQFAFRDDVPLVRLEVADEWVRPEQAVVRYRIETVFARSSWDWIGLYRVRGAGWGWWWCHWLLQGSILPGVTHLIPLTPGGFPPLQGLCGLCLGQTRRCGWERLPGTDVKGSREVECSLALGLRSQLGVVLRFPASPVSVWAVFLGPPGDIQRGVFAQRPWRLHPGLL